MRERLIHLLDAEGTGKENTVPTVSAVQSKAAEESWGGWIRKTAKQAQDAVVSTAGVVAEATGLAAKNPETDTGFMAIEKARKFLEESRGKDLSNEEQMTLVQFFLEADVENNRKAHDAFVGVVKVLHKGLRVEKLLEKSGDIFGENVDEATVRALVILSKTPYLNVNNFRKIVDADHPVETARNEIERAEKKATADTEKSSVKASQQTAAENSMAVGQISSSTEKKEKVASATTKKKAAAVEDEEKRALVLGALSEIQNKINANEIPGTPREVKMVKRQVEEIQSLINKTGTAEKYFSAVATINLDLKRAELEQKANNLYTEKSPKAFIQGVNAWRKLHREFKSMQGAEKLSTVNREKLEQMAAELERRSNRLMEIFNAIETRRAAATQAQRESSSDSELPPLPEVEDSSLRESSELPPLPSVSESSERSSRISSGSIQEDSELASEDSSDVGPLPAIEEDEEFWSSFEKEEAKSSASPKAPSKKIISRDDLKAMLDSIREDENAIIVFRGQFTDLKNDIDESQSSESREQLMRRVKQLKKDMALFTGIKAALQGNDNLGGLVSNLSDRFESVKLSISGRGEYQNDLRSLDSDIAKIQESAQLMRGIRGAMTMLSSLRLDPSLSGELKVIKSYHDDVEILGVGLVEDASSSLVRISESLAAIAEEPDLTLGDFQPARMELSELKRKISDKLFERTVEAGGGILVNEVKAIEDQANKLIEQRKLLAKNRSKISPAMREEYERGMKAVREKLDSINQKLYAMPLTQLNEEQLARREIVNQVVEDVERKLSKNPALQKKGLVEKLKAVTKEVAPSAKGFGVVERFKRLQEAAAKKSAAPPTESKNAESAAQPQPESQPKPVLASARKPSRSPREESDIDSKKAKKTAGPAASESKRAWVRSRPSDKPSTEPEASEKPGIKTTRKLGK